MKNLVSLVFTVFIFLFIAFLCTSLRFKDAWDGLSHAQEELQVAVEYKKKKLFGFLNNTTDAVHKACAATAEQSCRQCCSHHIWQRWKIL